MDVRGLLKDAFGGWSKHAVSRLAASLAYYAILSLAPLVVIVIGIAGLVFGADAARQALLAQVETLVGSEGARMIGTMVSHASSLRTNVVTGLLGVLTLLFGASGVFTELHESLDTVWDVRNKPGQGVWAMLRERFLSFGMILVVGFLLLISLLLSAGLAGIGGSFGHGVPAWVLQAFDFVVSVAVITILFAAIYRFLPSERLPWSDLWIGSFITSIGFVIGKFLLGVYLSRANVGSAYGAAGSLIVLLVWIYYSAQIFFLGAEFTRSYARRHGSLRSRADKSKFTLTAEAALPQTAPAAWSPAEALVPNPRVPLRAPAVRPAMPTARSGVFTLMLAIGWLGMSWWRERRRRTT